MFIKECVQCHAEMSARADEMSREEQKMQFEHVLCINCGLLKHAAGEAEPFKHVGGSVKDMMLAVASVFPYHTGIGLEDGEVTRFGPKMEEVCKRLDVGKLVLETNIPPEKVAQCLPLAALILCVSQDPRIRYVADAETQAKPFADSAMFRFHYTRFGGGAELDSDAFMVAHRLSYHIA